MARMIPAYFPLDAPPGEKAIYQALAQSKDTDDWIVLHSLAIADHLKKPESEADFVVIAPAVGLLVIEAKSHDYIDFRDGIWRLGAQDPISRGPFDQAKEAKYSIKKYLERKGVDFRSIPIFSVAWFTAVRARTTLPSSAEWHGWQVLDSEDLKKDPIGAIRRTFREGTAHLDTKIAHFSYGGVGPDESTARRIALLLRPNFEIGVSAGDLRNARQSQLVQFVEEQYSALDAMADNNAVLFTGPAGSGKTFLAMEAARRELAAGRCGRLICFNNFLAKRLTQDMPQGPELTVGTLHKQMLDVARQQTPQDAPGSFWTDELPLLALEALLEYTDDDRADFLIVDEVQDLMTDLYLDVLDLMVKGGLEKGRLLLFGDFERQALYYEGSGRELLMARVKNLAAFRLTVNCRNLPRIGYAVNRFSGLDPGYEKFRREDDGFDVTWLKYKRGEDQSALLREAIEALKQAKYELHEIVVLSPLGSESVAATTTDPWLRQVLKPADGFPAVPGQLLYSTIHAYKGLDSPAVVVTDLDRDAVPNFATVLYTGLTRATDRLFGLMEEKTGLAGLKGEL